MTNSIQFPVTIPHLWQSSDALELTEPYLRNWLLDTGSLTERLQSHCAKFELQVIGQRPMQPELEEISQFSHITATDKPQKWQVREVILFGNGQPWVFARSVLPQTLCEMDLAELGDRPLGQIIFNDPRFVRKPFQLLRIPQHHEFPLRLNLEQKQALWGRRSVFNFNALQLMVGEVFLPDCPAYRQHNL